MRPSFNTLVHRLQVNKERLSKSGTETERKLFEDIHMTCLDELRTYKNWDVLRPEIDWYKAYQQTRRSQYGQ